MSAGRVKGNDMLARIRPIHVILVAAIVALFGVRYFTRLDIPSWLMIGLAVIVLGGAIATSFYEFRKAQEGKEPLPADTGELKDPQFVSFLFSDIRTAPMWLIVRVYLGLQWLEAGWAKVTSEAWMDTGVAVQGYWTRAVAIPEEGQPAIRYDWYRDFLTFMLEREWYTWFAPLIAVGEVLVGIGLIVGALTGIAAAFGLLMNTSFMLAGTASTNPVLGALAIFIILGWKVAGHWGIDRYLLPAIGAPWSPGWLARRRERAEGHDEKPSEKGHAPIG
jgi:thiosulfate dehydrogenase (quinone) large subunit